MFKRLDIPISLRWNNRRFLGEVLESIGVRIEEKLSVMLTLDKIEKIGKDGVIKELISKGLDSQVTRRITELVEMKKPTFEYIANKYGIRGGKGALEVLDLQNLIENIELDSLCKFDPFLSRGLSFYTGTVYEIFDTKESFPSSLGGGGRYDAIIGKLVGREDIQYPCVGLSFGMESIIEMIKNRPIQTPQPRVVVIPIGETKPDVLKTAADLRANGIRTAVEIGKRKLKKSLANIASKGIRYVILVGQVEANDGKIRLKDMEEMTEEVISVQEAISQILQKQ